MVKRGDGRPRHHQIAAELRAQIMSGDLAPGQQLPITQDLASRFDVAGTTIQQALTALKDEGFLVGHRGKGVFVREREPLVVDVGAYFSPSLHGYSYGAPEVAELRPPANVVEALDLGSSGTAFVRRRVLFHDGEPVELSWSYYPADLARGTALASARKIKGGAPRVLEELGVPQREFVDEVSVRMPTTEEVIELDLPRGVPVVCQFRVVHAENQRPVEVSVLVKGSHLCLLRYHQQIP
ncbi:GntR family transcriptional regulator [Allokutzneria sp. A3M-2-11 16]|uniref:GntR family transcriptional regulator n=1 Tax=Allokutzneria sp. A3M-2-11 16 TaxID=2962043 RepID=UPI0020B68A89|nr:GntR family transcriptional regulator [Allokutzneria sp. A3M-2-11 16]MCP3801885.1 GntR family transcriptional regulator [Allokutzneria sp. A3M-2-11 16]